MTADSLRKWANEVPGILMGKHGKAHKVRIVQAPVFAMRYINLARYLTKDTMLEAGRLNKQRENNFPILQGKSLSSSKHFSTFKILKEQELYNIALGEEQLVHHGNKYELHGWSRL